MNMVTERPVARLWSTADFAEKPRGGSQSMEDVIKQLVQALLKGGSNSESGLGQMLKDRMAEGRPDGSAGGLEQLLSKLLEQLIGEKLGKDFGQSQAGGGGVGLGGGPNGLQSGGSNLMDRVLSGLAKSSLEGMLKPDGEGTRFEQKDAGMMQEVAKFMDAHPQQFPPPDAGSWGKELIEDKYLNKSETGAFNSAIDMIGAQLGVKASGQVDNAPSHIGGHGQDSLGGTGGLGSLSGGPGLAGGDILQELAKLLRGAADDLQNISSKLGVGTVEQGARSAADAIVGLMLPSGTRQA